MDTNFCMIIEGGVTVSVH